MRPVGADVEKSSGICPLAPTSAQQHPRTSRNAAVLALPCRDMLRHEQEVLVLRHLVRYVDHAGGTDEFDNRDRVRSIVRQVLAGDPMDWCVEMRPSVLAHVNRIPVPRRSLVVEA